MQYSVGVRNASLDQKEATIGVSPVLKLFSGAKPTDCAAGDPTGLLATITLPSDWLAAASAGSKSKLGTWSGSGSAGGNVASWRIYESTATTCHMQGTASATGGGGEMTFDNVAIANLQAVSIGTFQLNAGNA